jgi:TPR repeat protein
VLGDLMIADPGGKADVAEGRRWLLVAAEHDFASAQTELGNLCYKESDFKCAIGWYQKASDFDVDATAALGRMYYFGKGAIVDKTKARGLFSRAADQKEATSQFMMGAMNLDGEGGERNLTKARDYALAALENGYTDALATLTELYQYGGPGFPANAVEARKWAPKQGSPTCRRRWLRSMPMELAARRIWEKPDNGT